MAYSYKGEGQWNIIIIVEYNNYSSELSSESSLARHTPVHIIVDNNILIKLTGLAANTVHHRDYSANFKIWPEVDIKSEYEETGNRKRSQTRK